MWMIDLSFFSREVNVALCSCVRARWNYSERLRNVFRHLRILSDPTKNLATLKIKNVTPINVKKLAGLHPCSQGRGRDLLPGPILQTMAMQFRLGIMCPTPNHFRGTIGIVDSIPLKLNNPLQDSMFLPLLSSHSLPPS